MDAGTAVSGNSAAFIGCRTPLARLCRSRHARAIKAVASPAVAVRAAAHRRSLALCWRPRRRVRPRGIFLYSAEAEAEAPRVLAAFLASVRGET
jgi:hypothetical protein